MRTSAIFTIVLSAFAAAQSTGNTPTEVVENFISVANSTENTLITIDCHVKACLRALAPTIATCALSAAQEELDPINDALCFAAAAKLVASKPAACKHCY